MRGSALEQLNSPLQVHSGRLGSRVSGLRSKCGDRCSRPVCDLHAAAARAEEGR